MPSAIRGLFRATTGRTTILVTGITTALQGPRELLHHRGSTADEKEQRQRRPRVPIQLRQGALKDEYKNTIERMPKAVLPVAVRGKGVRGAIPNGYGRASSSVGVEASCGESRATERRTLSFRFSFILFILPLFLQVQLRKRLNQNSRGP